MVKIAILIVAFFSVLIAMSNVNALSVTDIEFPANIYLQEEKTINVFVYNNSLEDKELNVKLFVPEGLDYKITNLPQEIKAESRDSFNITLTPKSGVLGTNYIATLAVELGDDTILKETKIHFPALAEKGTQTGTTMPTGAFFLGLFENNEFVINIILLLIAIILFAVFLIKLRER